MNPKTRYPVLILVAAGLLVGCNTTSSTPTAGAQQRNKEETVSYTPVGSHISKRVKKPAKPAVDETNSGEELVRNMQSFGRISDQNEGSNATAKRPPN